MMLNRSCSDIWFFWILGFTGLNFCDLITLSTRSPTDLQILSIGHSQVLPQQSSQSRSSSASTVESLFTTNRLILKGFKWSEAKRIELQTLFGRTIERSQRTICFKTPIFDVNCRSIAIEKLTYRFKVGFKNFLMVRCFLQTSELSGAFFVLSSRRLLKSYHSVDHQFVSDDSDVRRRWFISSHFWDHIFVEGAVRLSWWPT